MIRINLIPPAYLNRQKQKTQVLRVAGVGLLGVLAVIVTTFLHINKTLGTEAIQKEKESKLKELQSKVEKVKELETVKASVEAHLTAIEGLLAARYYYPRFMADVVRTLTPSVWFASMITTLKDTNLIEARFDARSRTGEDLAGWLATVERSEKFTNPVMGPISVAETAAKVETYSFPLTITYNPVSGK